MKISIVRGAFLNPFELQNYIALKSRHTVTAVSSKNPINSKVGIPVIRLWSPTDLPNFPYKYPFLNRLLTDAHYLFGLEKVISGSDVVHVAETYFNYTIQAVRAKQRGLIGKLVSTCWEIIPFNNESIRGRKAFKQLARKNIDHFICPTDLAKRALIKEGVSSKKISVIRMGVDLARFHPVKPKPHATLEVLFVGRLVPEKGVNELLKALEICRQEKIKIHLTMIGSGPLAKRAREYGVSLKNIAYEDIHHAYQKADVFCLPSQNTNTWQEQYGMVLVEAMASGLPIVASSNGAIPEVCGKVALYANTNRPLADAFIRLSADKALRKKMSLQSRKRAIAEFDHRKIAKQIEQVYLKK